MYSDNEITCTTQKYIKLHDMIANAEDRYKGISSFILPFPKILKFFNELVCPVITHKRMA